VAATYLRRAMIEVDKLVPKSCVDTKKFAEISTDAAIQILNTLEPTLVSDGNPGFDWEAMRGLLRYFAEKSNGRVFVLAEKGRRLSKAASGDRSGISILGSGDLRDVVRSPTRKAPAIVLLQQVGGSELGWKAGPFWWPMLASPPRANSCVFATRVAA